MGTEAKINSYKENTSIDGNPIVTKHLSTYSTHYTNRSQNTSAVPYLSIFIAESDVVSGAKEILKTIRPHWNLNFVEFKSFTDGITNKLVGCFYTQLESNKLYCIKNTNLINNVEQIPNNTSNFTKDIVIDDDVFQTNNSTIQHSDNVVLVRVYGNKTDLLIDRKVETRNFLLLHSYGLAPSLYATFKNGLAYAYVPGVTLDIESVLDPEIWPLVARRMAEMHRVIQKENHSTQQTPMLWRKTQSFFDLVPEQFSDPEKHERIQSTFLPISRIREEFKQLYKHLECLNSPLVFSHNDLLLGNVIYEKTNKTVNFIDYEYADYNFQAFDIGNHFAEMCGVDKLDYTLYPKREFQWEWLRVYLQAFTCKNNIDEQDISRLYVQVNQFALAAHIFWTVWSLLQAEHSKIDFDFVNYAYLRYNEYLARKGEFLALTVHDEKV